MNTISLLAEAKQLPMQQRIQLVEQIWDSIVEAGQPISPTEAQQQELNRRLRNRQESPEAGRDWSEVKKDLMSRE